MKFQPAPEHQPATLVYGQPKPRELDLPEEVEALGPVETAAGRYAVVPVKDEQGEHVYHYVRKGLKWTLGPKTGTPYEPKSIESEPKPKRGATKRPSTRAKGADSGSTGSGQPAASAGTDEPAPEAADA